MRRHMSGIGGPARGLSAALRLAPFALVLLAAAPAQAQREDQGLQLGCANDYFRLCAGVDPNSPDAEACMTRFRGRRGIAVPARWGPRIRGAERSSGFQTRPPAGAARSRFRDRS